MKDDLDSDFGGDGGPSQEVPGTRHDDVVLVPQEIGEDQAVHARRVSKVEFFLVTCSRLGVWLRHFFAKSASALPQRT